MNQVKEAPWGFKADARENIHGGIIQERTDARPPDPEMEMQTLMTVKRMYMRSADVERYDPTRGCPWCDRVIAGKVLVVLCGHAL